MLPGLGAGSGMALEVIDALRREFSVDDRGICASGQSTDGAGAWNIIAHRPHFFAAVVICCGSVSSEDSAGSIETPLWNFHGDSDQAVPVSVSRDRIAARRNAGAIRSRPNMPAWITSAGNGFSPNQRSCRGCSLNIVTSPVQRQ